MRDANARFFPAQKSQLAFKIKLAMHLWCIVRAVLFQWSPDFWRGFRRFLLRLFGAQISPSASISNKACIDCPWNLEMADFASVGEYAWIYALDKIHIGRGTCVGQHVMLIAGTHDYCDPTFELITMPITIGQGAWLAVSTIVLPGITIGDYCVLGAGSVVTKDMPALMVCAGNPCAPIKRRQLRSNVR